MLVPSISQSTETTLVGTECGPDEDDVDKLSVSPKDSAANDGSAPEIISRLQRAWGWIHDYSTPDPPSPYLTTFRRRFTLSIPDQPSLIHLTADTRYKLFINGHRAMIGPSRGSDKVWYFDTLDISSFLLESNEIIVQVVRYPHAFDGAYTHARTVKPGFSFVGEVGGCDLSTDREGWECRIERGVELGQRLPFDTNLHNFETVTQADNPWQPFVPYNLETRFGLTTPWRLEPRMIPLPDCTPIPSPTIRFSESNIRQDEWEAFFEGRAPIKLSAGTHRLELEFACDSTAFLKVTAQRPRSGSRLRMTYSEAYEEYERKNGLPLKGIRDQRERHCLRGPHDEYTFGGATEDESYEPFWWRTFRFIVFEVEVRDGLTLLRFDATQTNYPLAVKAVWEGDGESDKLWDISVRTLRNCLFDGYSDCPFYEQLQYCQDTRSSALFHYCLSGDDRLARQAIHAFASSIHDGVIQARYPAQRPQVITGFSLFWVLQVCDHLQFFNDRAFARRYLPIVDTVLDFFHRHIGPYGLVEGLPKDHWLFVDWVDRWESLADGSSPGVPLAGRKNGIFTYFSMLYAYVLGKAAELATACGRHGVADEYTQRQRPLVHAIQEHCFDGRFFTDSLADASHAYSQHCQVWGILCGAARQHDEKRILMQAFYPETASPTFSACSYPQWFYAYRAFSQVGIYERVFDRSLAPWRTMMNNNLTTWEEDPVSRRSDCHAWSSTYIFEAMTEIAGLKPLASGWTAIAFCPKVSLSPRLDAKFPLGRDQVAHVRWSQETHTVILELRYAADVMITLPDGSVREEHQVSRVVFEY